MCFVVAVLYGNPCLVATVLGRQATEAGSKDFLLAPRSSAAEALAHSIEENHQTFCKVTFKYPTINVSNMSTKCQSSTARLNTMIDEKQRL